MTTNEKCPNCGEMMIVADDGWWKWLQCCVRGPSVRAKGDSESKAIAAWHSFLAKVRAGK